MQEMVLNTKSLTVGYGGTAVVENIELLASAGKILTLIGPNGAGKSTILKTLIRQLKPLAGAVYLGDGCPLDSINNEELARYSAAVLTGRPEPELMTCEDVVSSGRYPYTGRMGILSPEDRRKVFEAMELVGISHIRNKDFNRISDGQRQRVMLARAICQEPRLLVMDEPTSFLDIRHKLDFLYLLKSLVWEKKLAVVMSMHELDLAQKFSDTVLCIRNGKIDRCGTPEEIFAGGYIEQLYGVEHGRYDDVFGCMEPEPCHGKPKVFVIGGGGKGVPIYRSLQRKGVPFAVGVLPENDMDMPVAAALAEAVISERAFEPVGKAAVEKAMKILEQCIYLICCIDRFGTMNQENRRLLDYGREHGMLLPVEAIGSIEL